MEVVSKLNQKIFYAVMLLAVALMFVIVYSVFFRYFLGRADARAFFFSVWFYGTLSILAGGWVLKTGGHVSVDILYKRLSEKVRKFLDYLSLTIIVVVCAVLLYPGLQIAWRSTLIGEVDSSLGIVFAPPIWWYRWVAVIAVILVLIQAVELMYSKLVRRG